MYLLSAALLSAFSLAIPTLLVRVSHTAGKNPVSSPHCLQCRVPVSSTTTTALYRQHLPHLTKRPSVAQSALPGLTFVAQAPVRVKHFHICSFTQSSPDHLLGASVICCVKNSPWSLCLFACVFSSQNWCDMYIYMYTITKNPRRCFPFLCSLKTIFNFKTLFRFWQGVCEILGLSFPLLYFAIQERTRLTYFDYGDIICREGEMPQGIFLIISGMASVRATTFSSFKCILNIQL